MRWIGSALLAVGAALLILTAALRLAGIDDGPWPLPAILAFTPYLVPVAFALALLALVLRRHLACALLVVPAGVLVLVVGPRTVAEDQPPARGPQLTMMSANLLHDAADAGALARLVRERRPDVLALQEVKPTTEARLRRAGILDALPHMLAREGTTWNDTALLANRPLRARAGSGLPSVYLVADLQLRGGRRVPLISAHPTPPVTPDGQRRWAGWLRDFPAPEGPFAGGLAAGDFNATLDHPEFRAILERGWRDAARERGAALTPTWSGAQVLRLTLDHVLVPPGAAVREFHVDDLPGSDHDVVTATVVLPELG